MHPLEKIIVLLALCQALQTIYMVAHVHALHRRATRLRYLAKMAPLMLVTLAMCALVLRVFNAIPYIGI